MGDLLLLDQQFKALRSLLRESGHEGVKLSRIASFMAEHSADGIPSLQARELVLTLKSILDKQRQPETGDPAPCARMLEWVQALPESTIPPAELDAISRTLRRSIALRWAFVGDWEKMFTALGCRKSVIDASVHAEDDRVNLDILASISDHRIVEDESVFNDIGSILETWQATVNFFQNRVWVPIVDVKGNDNNDRRKQGFLTEAVVDVDIRSRKKSIGIEVLWSGIEPGSSAMQSARRSVLAGINSYGNARPSDKPTFLRATISMSTWAGRYTGRSAELGLSALVFMALGSTFKYRHRFLFSTTTAITGKVNEDGTVLPVSMNSLRSKTEAVFFSWIDTFIVPAEQEGSVKDWVANLNLVYPNRRLRVLPAENIADIVSSRRVTKINKKHRRELVQRQLIRYQVPLLAILSLFLAGFLYLKYLPNLDDIVQNVRIDGDRIILVNSSDAEVDRLWFGRPWRPLSYRQFDRHHFFDTALDPSSGKQMFCWSYQTGTSRFPNAVACKQPRASSVLFSTAPFGEKDSPSSRVDDFFGDINAIAGPLSLYQRSENEPLVLVVSGNSVETGESFIRLVDPLTGRVLETYAHNGLIRSMDLLRGRHKESVAVSGLNSEYGEQFFIAILDLSSLAGYGPGAADNRLGQQKAAAERAYLRFLPSRLEREIIGESGEWDQDHVKARRHAVITGTTSIPVSGDLAPVLEFQLPLMPVSMNPALDQSIVPVESRGGFSTNFSPYFVIWLDTELRPLGIHASISFDKLVESLAEQQRLGFPQNRGRDSTDTAIRRYISNTLNEYLETGLVYWNGEKWLDSPASQAPSD